MANEGSTKATYSELIKCSCDPMNLAEPCDWCLGMAARRTLPLLESELARVRGLLQRQYQKDVVLGLLQRIGANHNLEYCDCEFCQFRSEFYKLLVPSSAESVDIGKLDTADKKPTLDELVAKITPENIHKGESGVEMGKVNMVDELPYVKLEWTQEEIENFRKLTSQPPAPPTERDFPHKTVPVLAWADIDVAIAPVVEYLNTIPGIRTDASCQGTIGQGGPNPYRAYVMARWTDEARERLASGFDFDPLGDNWGYIKPKGGAIHFASAGSAETGGEKAAPDYENDPAHKQCVGFSDWNALLYEISKFYAKIDPEWADADIDQMDEFDPWEALRKLQANFPRSSQNQTVSGGVEGAHEGTTADKSDSRAPEKLNNAQNEARYSTENMLLPCAKCGERRAHVNHYAEYGGDHRFEPAAESKALAESSLSSPPPTKDDLSIPTSPAPLPTQLEMTKEKL